jgi:SRSO17 transposase
MNMLARAFEAAVPFAWITADEAYGQVKYLRTWLEDRDAAYVLATKVNDLLDTTDGAEGRADELIAGLPARAWRRLSVGAGAHGPREYDWARIPIGIGWRAGRGHWLLARRSLSDPTEIAYYVCCGPRRSTLLDLAWIAGTRWRIEECFQQAKNEAGLDHYQVRSWRAWYAHITLSMLAHAWLAVSRSLAIKGESVSTNQA